MDSEDELKKIEQTLYNQKKAGILVKYILKEAIKNKTISEVLSNKVESLDFALIDEKLLIVPIDGKRQIMSAQVLLNSNAYNVYKNLYTNLFGEAEEVSNQLNPTKVHSGSYTQ